MTGTAQSEWDAAIPSDSDKRRWSAVLARDESVDGQFFYAVKTTGIYCRPSCPSRAPKRENVSFFADKEAAERGGYRPCKRCKPDQYSGDNEPQGQSIESSVNGLPWDRIESDLDSLGYGITGPLLTAKTCRALTALYEEHQRFRSRVVMQRHSFGSGEYQYFANPLPEVVADLRRAAYPRLALIANRWSKELGLNVAYPTTLNKFLRRCHDAGQQRPTPLLLKYGPDDYNRLHQDLYGPLHFPLQMAILLSNPTQDFSGGEFLITEQRPRTQSRAEVVPLRQGEAAIFPVNHRPARGGKGYYRLTMRHGVSRVRSGQRYCLGIIFHDAA